MVIDSPRIVSSAPMSAAAYTGFRVRCQGLSMSELLDRIDRLNEIGIALSAESDTPKLLELIMMGAKALTEADGGSLYFLKNNELRFEIISNDTLDIQMGGTSGKEITFPAIPLLIDGSDSIIDVVAPMTTTFTIDSFMTARRSTSTIDDDAAGGNTTGGSKGFDISLDDGLTSPSSSSLLLAS